MANRRKTFSEIKQQLEETNSETLMRKARLANRIAKTVRGRNKRAAYRAKTRALSSLVKRMPDKTDVRKDIVLTDFVVVELRGTNRGLHIPNSALGTR